MSTTGRSTLSEALGTETRNLHRTAERTRTMGALLRGSLPLSTYVAMLRNQHAVYESLEAAIARCAATDSLLGWLDREALARAAPMERDLVHIHGAGWRDDIPLRREATAYADEIDALGRTEPVGVIAHAWVRYMGDVSGGQILARLVRKHYGLGDEGTETYSFPALGDIDAFKADFRARLDARPDDEGLRMIEHARSGFGHSIALLDALVPE